MRASYLTRYIILLLFNYITTMKKLLLLLPLLVAPLLFLTGCSDADTVSHNISKEADYFNVYRRIVFYNGITNEYMMSIEWRCSLGNDNTDKQISVTCKVAEGQYKKHFLWLSDNVTYFIEQMDSKNVSKNHYKVVFKPSVITPDIDIR